MSLYYLNSSTWKISRLPSKKWKTNTILASVHRFVGRASTCEPRKQIFYFPLNPGCLIGILVMVYPNPCCIVSSPVYPKQLPFFHYSCVLRAFQPNCMGFDPFTEHTWIPLSVWILHGSLTFHQPPCIAPLVWACSFFRRTWVFTSSKGAVWAFSAVWVWLQKRPKAQKS